MPFTAPGAAGGGIPISTPFTYEDAGAADPRVVSSTDNAKALGFDTSGGPRGVTLPSASAVGIRFSLALADTTGDAFASNLTITADGTDTIQGAATIALAQNYASIILVSNGVDGWIVL